MPVLLSSQVFMHGKINSNFVLSITLLCISNTVSVMGIT